MVKRDSEEGTGFLGRVLEVKRIFAIQYEYIKLD